jgi:hypothetical protein
VETSDVFRVIWESEKYLPVRIIFSLENFREIVMSYLEAALWESTDDDGVPLDNEYSIWDITWESRVRAASDVLDFLLDAIGVIVDVPMNREHVGHNIWLNRNGCGEGFWSRGLGAAGDTLSVAAKQLGEIGLSVGDDDRLHMESG